MNDWPLTVAEAEAKRYNYWAGNPRGTAYDPKRCAGEVSHDHYLFYQCSRKPKTGPDKLYCGWCIKRLESYLKQQDMQNRKE